MFQQHGLKAGDRRHTSGLKEIERRDLASEVSTRSTLQCLGLHPRACSRLHFVDGRQSGSWDCFFLSPDCPSDVRNRQESKKLRLSDWRGSDKIPQYGRGASTRTTPADSGQQRLPTQSAQVGKGQLPPRGGILATSLSCVHVRRRCPSVFFRKAALLSSSGAPASAGSQSAYPTSAPWSSASSLALHPPNLRFRSPRGS